MPRPTKSAAATASAAAAFSSTNPNDKSAIADDDQNVHRLRQDIDSLHQEMEVAQHGTDLTGHNFTKKLSKKQYILKMRKRRTLEEQDLMTEQQQNQMARATKRLRGPQVSYGEEVIQGSLVIQPGQAQENSRRVTAEEDAPDDGEMDDADERLGDQGGRNRDSLVHDDDDDEEEADDVDDDDERDPDDDEGADDNAAPAQAKPAFQAKAKASAASLNKAQKPRKKGGIRMRNFKSIKLAEQHGEALDAHTRGRHAEAIQKLKQIAREAPSAPQIYSSLGMVYCDLLREASERLQVVDNSDVPDACSEETASADDLLAEQLELAKKAYGAYHVAAILCKRDYALWVRAADMACQVGDLHMIMMTKTTNLLRDHHKSERLRWLNEARNDYQTSDNLRPPGIDIPAKLATMQMELGHLSEALTVLTDLKNRNVGPAHASFASSYRAWWLYADLMLKLGKECDRWNRGDQSNTNYMFRRWLRKHSKKFDWKERRLQALVKTLEAAAGSVVCRGLVDWLASRAMVSSVSALDAADHTDPSVADQSDEATGKPKSIMTRETILLDEKSRNELLAFGNRSEELSLDPGHEPFLLRQSARDNLLIAEKEARDGLVDEFCLRKAVTADAKHVLAPELGKVESLIILPMSASVNTVTDIASELMQLALDMHEYQCGVLAGTSISLYMKQRAKMFEPSNRRRDYQQKPILTGLFADGASGYSSDSDESLCQLSDDEDSDLTEMRSNMEKGVLPPEISVLHGCCLAGQGGANFLAYKFMDSIRFLPDRIYTVDTDTAMSNDAKAGLQVTERRMRNKTDGFYLVAHYLRRMGKIREFSSWLAPHFDAYVDMLAKSGALDLALARVTDELQTKSDRWTQIHQVMSASSEFLLVSAETLIGTENQGEAIAMIAAASARIGQLITATWAVEEMAKSLSLALVKLIRQMEFAALLSLKVFTDSNDIIQLFEPAKNVVAIFSGASFNVPSTLATPSPSVSEGLISSSWLSEFGQRLALRAINLCVATNVSFFSGWEDRQFDLTLIRRKAGLNHFGISIRDGLVYGKLTAEVEDELLLQWDLIAEAYPDLLLDFRARLTQLRQEATYLDGKMIHEKALREGIVSRHGERESLHVLLLFSRMCLLNAREEVDVIKQSLQMTSLSIMLPLTQFCVEEQLWDSGIGKLKDETNAIPHPLGNNQLFLRRNDEETPGPPASIKQSDYVRRTKRTQNDNSYKDTATNIIADIDFASASSFIAIPSSLLLKEWCSSDEPHELDDTFSEKRMVNLNSRLHVLRRCSTEAAAEKAALNVAVALISIAANARNPFLCLEQAARFASMAPKRGMSDMAFQARLPEELACTPLDALVILGRADCLQAVFFCEEAAFLCDFVASICRVHRSHSESFTSQRWRLVCVKTYNVYLAIRYTAAIVANTKDKVLDYKTLNEEIPIYRNHAIDMQLSAKRMLQTDLDLHPIRDDEHVYDETNAEISTCEQASPSAESLKTVDV